MLAGRVLVIEKGRSMSNYRFDGADDVLDSRDIIERIQELTAEWESVTGNVASDYILSEDDWAVGLGESNAAELVGLLEFADEGELFSDWRYGVTFVADHYWTEYVRELLDDVGYIPRDLPAWIEIDWEATADNVQTDYSGIELNGTTYWGRA